MAMTTKIEQHPHRVYMCRLRCEHTHVQRIHMQTHLSIITPVGGGGPKKRIGLGVGVGGKSVKREDQQNPLHFEVRAYA